MLVDDLYKSVLIKPATEKSANKLYIISGYASATFARRHISELLDHNDKTEVYLIIGMPGAKNDHLAFLQMHKEYKDRFHAYYLQNNPPVHCKVYSWFFNDDPKVGYAGSANYSQFGFFSDQQLNQISKEDPELIKSLYDELLKRCVYIPDHKIILPSGHRPPGVTHSVFPGTIKWEIPDKRVRISFLDKKGRLPEISGLNWGQREGREPNQAYLSLKGDSRKAGFLPELAYTFTLITDDGQTFDCAVAQQGRKAIHTNKNNSLIGKYIRKRIGVKLGSMVKIEDLEKYGRTDYTIEKIDDETFLLDMSI